jgi:hypothetical protein
MTTKEVIGATARKKCLYAASLSLRIFGAVLGGYAFSASVVALVSLALPHWLGLPRGEVAVGSGMFGFVLYLGILLWAFSERSVLRIWALLFWGAFANYWLVQWLATMQVTFNVNGV